MSDLKIIRIIWLLVIAAIISLFPFTIFSTFLVPIAESVHHSTAEVATLRGLGGIAALVVGISFAPFINRFTKSNIGICALLLLGLSSLVGASGTYLGLVAFCFSIGAATALLTPSLLAIAAEQFKNENTAARAATIITSTQSLAAVMAAPVIGGMALLGGWRGAFFATSVVSLFVAGLLLWRRKKFFTPPQVSNVNYLEAFRRISRQPLLLSLLFIAMLRTAAFMGCLAYAAGAYHHYFQLSAETFTLIWTVSGFSFFVGNFYSGKFLNDNKDAIRYTQPLLIVGLIVATIAVVMVFLSGTFAIALAGTVLMGISHAVIAACITTLIVRKGGESRNQALTLNSAGMSFGVFLGASIGGVGMAVSSYTGVGVALCVLTVIAFGIASFITVQK